MGNKQSRFLCPYNICRMVMTIEKLLGLFRPACPECAKPESDSYLYVVGCHGCMDRREKDRNAWLDSVRGHDALMKVATAVDSAWERFVP